MLLLNKFWGNEKIEVEIAHSTISNNKMQHLKIKGSWPKGVSQRNKAINVYIRNCK